METTIMENQMEKKMENEMEYIGVILGLYLYSYRKYVSRKIPIKKPPRAPAAGALGFSAGCLPGGHGFRQRGEVLRETYSLFAGSRGMLPKKIAMSWPGGKTAICA